MNSKNNFELRDYQKQAKKEILNNIRNKFRGKIILENNNSYFQSADLLEMATGSGKTLVSGEILSHIIEVKDRLGEKFDFGGLNILVLTNRIDGVNQFYEDWFEGRDDKKPIFSEKILARSEAKIFHSKGEDLDNYENFSENNKHKIFFSTYQTANLKNLAEKLNNIDMIIIDEAHNVGFEESEFNEVLKNLEKKGRNGHKPGILALTATPDNVTKENFGESAFTFGLPEYLASRYSPSVNYQVIAGTSVENDEIKKLENKINYTKSQKDFDTKKEMIKNLENDLDQIFAKSPSLEALCKDILGKISENSQIKKSIIFVNSIDEANKVAETLNEISQTNSAIAYHSQNNEKNILKKFSENGETKILVVVDKINESVDLPVVENVVFYRNTNNGKIFLQQFGRGLRGNNMVNYFDYVGSLKNFSWIGNIYKQYRERLDSKKSSEKNEKNPNKFNVFGGNIQTQNFDIDLYELVKKISELKEETELTQESVREYFLQKDLEYWKNLKSRERENVEIQGHRLFAISRLFGIKGDLLSYKNIWYEFLEKIFEIEVKQLTQESVREYFLQKDLDYWKNLSVKERKNIEIQGSKIKLISRLFGVLGDPATNKDIWHEFLEKIFETKIEVNELTQESVREYFLQKDLEYWKNLKIKERKNIEIQGSKMQLISRLFGIEGNPVGYKNIWHEFLEKIFEIEVKQLTQESVREYFLQKDLEYWKNLKSRERENVEIQGHRLFAISRLFGIKGDPIRYNEVWYEFLEKIFEIEVKQLTQEDVREYFLQKDLDYWKNLKSRERKSIEIQGNKLFAISSLFGIEGDPISYNEVWYEFLEKIFETK